MKLCDRCFKRDGSITPAVDVLVFQADDVRLDVCQGCKEEVTEFVQNPGGKSIDRKKQNKK